MLKTPNWLARLSVAALSLIPALAAAQVAPCGTPGTPPCSVPEPATWPLVVLALGVAAAVGYSKRK